MTLWILDRDGTVCTRLVTRKILITLEVRNETFALQQLRTLKDRKHVSETSRVVDKQCF